MVSELFYFRTFCFAFYKKQKPKHTEKTMIFGFFQNVPGGSRTHGLSLRRRTLYPAELRRHFSILLFYHVVASRQEPFEKIFIKKFEMTCLYFPRYALGFVLTSFVYRWYNTNKQFLKE